MPQNPESSIPLDDEDILDLTEVADPDKGSDGPPEPGNGGADFGADLDALLDSLAPDGTVSAATAPAAEAAALESPVAAPIKDQTPVTHKVDPNEEMAMPETSDIDSLLAELGADIPPDTLAPEVEEKEAPKPAAAPIADFDNLLAQAQAAEAQKAAEEVVVSAETQPAPVVANVPAAPVTEPEIEPELEADDAESLDLNELDALLDDILATAPEMSVPAQSAAAVESPAETADATLPQPPVAEVEALSEDDGLPDVIPVPEAALMPNEAPDSSIDARLRRLEDAMEVLETEANNQLSESMVDALIDVKLAALLAPGSDAMAKIVEEVVLQLTVQEAGGDNAALFREKLEKMAAAAAAKVIREEIAALMSE